MNRRTVVRLFIHPMMESAFLPQNDNKGFFWRGNVELTCGPRN
jgi:hypothetical protein